jgi:hypothetical protein
MSANSRATQHFFEGPRSNDGVSELANCLPIAPKWSWQVGEGRRTATGSLVTGV